MMSSSSASGAFLAGLIPGTGPHFLKSFELKKIKKFIQLTNELRLISLDLPETELASEDLTVKNKMIDTFTKIMEKSPDLCELYDEVTSEEFVNKIQESEKYYQESGRDSIWTLGGKKDWRDYSKEYIEPTDEMKELYKEVDLAKAEQCSRRDDDGHCLPLNDYGDARRDVKDTCEDLKEMLELGPAELVEQILKEVATPDEPEASE
tara:strand:+ start:54 stop:674 length:621 start_codon:yes stop_codon:yes gene_type:complete